MFTSLSPERITTGTIPSKTALLGSLTVSVFLASLLFLSLAASASSFISSGFTVGFTGALDATAPCNVV